MLADELENGRAGATDPLHIVCVKSEEPLSTVFGDNDGEQVGDCVIVVWIGEDQLAAPFGGGERGEGCGNRRRRELGAVVVKGTE